MDIKQITEAINRIFIEKKKRIIFWYDGDKEFEEILPEIDLEGVCILRIDECAALDLKIRLEVDDPSGKYVLYAPVYEPPPEKDWLFDIRLYSHCFHADRASILLNELNLSNRSLRPYLKERNDFFKSQDRSSRLKKWVTTDDMEADLDLKMLAVVTKADQYEPFAILMKLFDSFCQDGTFDPNAPSKAWAEIDRLGLADSFWKLQGRLFGYIAGETPTLNDFALHLFATDFSNNLKESPPDSISHFVLRNPNLSMNASVFLSQWRSHTGHFKNFNIVSKYIAKRLKIDDEIIQMDMASLIEAMTFEACERRIISSLRDKVGKGVETDFDAVRKIIKARLDGYWANTVLREDSPQNLYKTTYHALENALQLFELRKEYPSGLSYPSAFEMYKAYTDELFLFDQYYRKFYELSDRADYAGWDVLKPLKETVDNCYSNWFMEQIGVVWGGFLEKDRADNLLGTWKIPNVWNQNEFFKRYVKPTVKESTRNRLFVVISDAFRYEAAEELTRYINGKYRLQANLETMLGVVPGYTALGMASLLPHETIAFKEGGHGDVVLDGKLVASMEQRSAVLSKYEGIAVKADDLLSMSKEKGREFVKAHRIIWLLAFSCG